MLCCRDFVEELLLRCAPEEAQQLLAFMHEAAAAR